MTEFENRVTGLVTEQLRLGTSPFLAGWQAGEQRTPYNPATGKDYRASNALWLMAAASEGGFADPRWLTFKQVQRLGGHVHKGERGTSIQYWQFEGRAPDGIAVRYEKPRLIQALVFNAEQTDGLPAATRAPTAPLNLGGINAAVFGQHPIGSRAHAQSMMRADMVALLASGLAGSSYQPREALARTWLQALDEPRELFRAAADADKTVQRLQAREGEQEQQPSPPETPPLAVRPPVIIKDNHPAMTPSNERTYLAVPYDQKDDAKELGAKWDGRAKAWYAPAGADLEAFSSWLPARGSVHIAVDANPVDQFAEALRECGLQIEGAPAMDGQMHRVTVEGDRGAARSGAYKAHLDGRPAGFIQNFRTGVKVNWKASTQAAALGAQDRAQMAAEAAQKRHDRAREREQQAERTAQQVDAIWAAATPAQAHPYLADKGVQAHGLRQAAPGLTIAMIDREGRPCEVVVAGQLLVPVANADGKLSSLQFVRDDGSKMFMPGGRVEGGHFVVGDINRRGPLLIAEGFATAATLNELTGMPAIVAFNAGNLSNVAVTYRTLYPDRAIYVAGDDDRKREAEGKPNVGRESAEKAAALIGGQAVFPPFPLNTIGSDWNDLAKVQGKPYAAAKLEAAINTVTRESGVQEPGAQRGLSRAVARAFGFGKDRGAAREMEVER